MTTLTLVCVRSFVAGASLVATALRVPRVCSSLVHEAFPRSGIRPGIHAGYRGRSGVAQPRSRGFSVLGLEPLCVV
jgi:hypothetical protein